MKNVNVKEDVLLQVEELEARIAPDGGVNIPSAAIGEGFPPPTDRAKPPTLPSQAQASWLVSH